ncbi:ferritin family protein [Thiomicrorhabdus sp. Milos-T2]|uniref:ferritin family protein n=1 Tax=Thiomicrorhabdus sp. Milos-T2 TaxID=90814 RepID=UPI00049474CF|nr:ferritin family protein [Thiomicrorhabdus sp. Milos-T2]
MKKFESYRCKQCGNVVEVSTVGGGTLVCCGQEMECTTENLTLVNLLKAFAGESMARNKYEFYAKIAQKEGFRDVARHFQRAANNEKEHAKLEFKLQNMIKSSTEFGDTLANLQDAIEGESYENLTMYPEFEAIAKEEGNNDAARLFGAIGKVELEHQKMYKELLERLKVKEEFESVEGEEEWICEVCGHVHRGKKPPKACPVCNHPQEYFSRLLTKQ